MARIPLLAVTTILTAIAAATPAHALDLTGTWIGTVECKAQINGVPGRTFESPLGPRSKLEISQVGKRLFMKLDGNSALHYAGWASPDRADNRKGMATLVSCDTSATEKPILNEIISARVKTRARSPIFRGRSSFNEIRRSKAWQGGTCQYVHRRVSRSNPRIGTCPGMPTPTPTMTSTPTPTSCSLTGSRWLVEASEPSGNCTAALHFTSQVRSGSGSALDGYFDWRCGSATGREMFEGLLSNGTVHLQGVRFVNAPRGFGLGTYTGNVTGSCNKIVNGTYPSDGHWSARR